MVNENAPERPNRVVTCQTCGVQMPQRYLAKHMQGHAQAAQSPDLAGDGPGQSETMVPPALKDTGPGRESAGTLICPVCKDFVAEDDLNSHMQALHSNWCPLCHARTKGLVEHLRARHRLKPMQAVVGFERNWETQKRYICLGCKKKVSVWSYPKHEGPHGAARGPAQPPLGKPSGPEVGSQKGLKTENQSTSPGKDLPE